MLLQLLLSELFVVAPGRKIQVFVAAAQTSGSSCALVSTLSVTICQNVAGMSCVDGMGKPLDRTKAAWVFSSGGL